MSLAPIRCGQAPHRIPSFPVEYVEDHDPPAAFFAMTTRRTIGPLPLRIFFWSRKRGYKFDRFKRRLASRFFKLMFRWMYRDRVSFRAIDYFASDDKERWTQAEPASVRLTIVVVTYKQPIQLECLLASLSCQTLQNFEVMVIHDGADAETRSVMDRFIARSDRFSYVETDVRYNDWGHSLRAAGIQRAQGEFLLITNGDNYYMPRFTEFVFEAIETQELDVAVWDIVHSYNYPGLIDVKSYSPVRVYPARWMVDISSVIVRTQLAKIAGFTDKSHDGDATYLEEVLSASTGPIKVGKIEKTLNVHN